jgi:hypothetical protein
MSTTPRILAQLTRGRKNALDIASFGHVARVSDAANLLRHRGCARLVAIDTNHLGAGLCERVTGLPSNPVAPPSTTTTRPARPYSVL